MDGAYGPEVVKVIGYSIMTVFDKAIAPLRIGSTNGYTKIISYVLEVNNAKCFKALNAWKFPKRN